MARSQLSSKPTHGERTAAAGVVAIVAGLVLPNAAGHSLDRAVFVWLIFAILIGLLLGAKTKVGIAGAVKQALIPALLLPLTYAGFWFVRFLADSSKLGFLARSGFDLSGRALDLSNPLALLLVGAILIVLFLATLVVVSLASIGTRPIVLSLVEANRLGPEGFDRMKKVVVSIGALVAVVSALWLLVSRGG